MNRRRLRNILIGTGLALVVLAGVAWWGMNVAVDKMLNAFVDEALASISEPDSDAESSEATMPTPHEPEDVQPSTHPSTTEQPDETEVTTPSEEPVAGGSTPGATPAPPTGASTPAPAVTPEPSPTYSGEITPDKAEQAKEKVTAEEKLKITTIFLKRFTPKELSAFMTLAKDGVTLEEKREAKKIVLQKLTEEEYDELIAIAAKLGLSQGKSYQESLKEDL